MSRRRFLAFTSCGCACAAGRPARALEGPTRPVEVGKLSDFSKDGITDGSGDFFVVRRDGKLYAVTSICTHMTEPLMIDSQDTSRIKCTSHGSVFDDEGRVMVGPASQSLARLGISLDKEGRVMVDPSRTFPEDKWEEKGSYIEIA